MDTEMVPDEFGHFPEYWEVTGTPRGLLGLMGLFVEERRQAKVWRVPPLVQTELD